MLAFLVYIALLGFHYRKLINLLEILKFQFFSHFIPSVSPFVQVFIKIIFEFCIFQHITRKFGSELQTTALENFFYQNNLFGYNLISAVQVFIHAYIERCGSVVFQNIYYYIFQNFTAFFSKTGGQNRTWEA